MDDDNDPPAPAAPRPSVFRMRMQEAAASMEDDDDDGGASYGHDRCVYTACEHGRYGMLFFAAGRAHLTYVGEHKLCGAFEYYVLHGGVLGLRNQRGAHELRLEPRERDLLLVVTATNSRAEMRFRNVTPQLMPTAAAAAPPARDIVK